MNPTMKKTKWLKWLVVGLVVAALAAGLLRAVSARKAAQTAAAALAAKPSQSMIELAQTDVVQVKMRELAQGLAISGALKAANSAFIKARGSRRKLGACSIPPASFQTIRYKKGATNM